MSNYNTTTPLVSVIIPVYNSRKTLKRAVNSVLKQSYPQLELILIDDASTDGSATLCEDLAKSDSRIRTIHQPSNQGVEVARHTAIQASQGKYVMFCDSDDWLSYTIMEKCVAIAERENVDAVHFQHYRVYDALGFLQQKVVFREEEKKLDQQGIMDSLYPSFFGISGHYVSMCSYCYRRTLLEEADITPLGQGVLEDQTTNMRIMPHMKSLYLSTEYGYFYRYGGRTSKYALDTLEEMKRLYHFEIECIKKYNVKPSSFDFSAYEMQNNFLHHVEELIILGQDAKQIFEFINNELEDSIYSYLFEIYASRMELSPLDQAVKEKDAEKIYTYLLPIAQKHRRKRCLMRLFLPLLRIL